MYTNRNITKYATGGDTSHHKEFLKITSVDQEAITELLESLQQYNIYTSSEIKYINDVAMYHPPKLLEVYDPTANYQISHNPDRGQHPCRPDLVHSSQLDTRNLFIGDLQFLTEYVNRTRPTVVVYVGAAPSYHHAFLRELFPNIVWHLFDTMEIIATPLDSVTHIHQEEFTMKHARKWSGKVDLFICNYRRDNSDPITFEIDVASDMEAHVEWARVIQPTRATMIKFHPPYGREGTYQKIKYPKCKIRFQSWNAHNSLDTRQIILTEDLDTEVDFDIKHYRNTVEYLNMIVRPWVTFESPAPNLHQVHGYDRCHNCTMEATTWNRYLEKVRYMFNGHETTTAKLMTLTGKKLNQQLYISEADRNNDGVSRHGEFSIYPAPRRNLMICNSVPDDVKIYIPPTQGVVKPTKRPVLVFGDTTALQIGYNTKFGAEFTIDAKENFVGFVGFNCGLYCISSGDYNNFVTTSLDNWRESTIGLRDTPLDLILITGNHDLYVDYFYRYRAYQLSDEKFMTDFITNYSNLLNAKLAEFPQAQITVVAVLPIFIDNLLWIEDVKIENLNAIKSKIEDVDLELVVKLIMDQNRLKNLITNYNRWSSKLTPEQKSQIYDMNALNARRKEINRRLGEYISYPSNPQVKFVNFEDEVLANYDKYRNYYKHKPYIDPPAFRELLTTVVPGIANYLLPKALPEDGAPVVPIWLTKSIAYRAPKQKQNMDLPRKKNILYPPDNQKLSSGKTRKKRIVAFGGSGYIPPTLAVIVVVIIMLSILIILVYVAILSANKNENCIISSSLSSQSGC